MNENESEYELKNPEDEHKIVCDMPADYCYDCLKTKGFGISLILIAMASLFTIIAVVPTLLGEDVNPFKLIGFIVQWVLITGFILLMGMFAWLALGEYCNKNSNTYKDTWYVAGFAVSIIIAIITIIASIITIGPSYNEMVAIGDWKIHWGWFGLASGIVIGLVIAGLMKISANSEGY